MSLFAVGPFTVSLLTLIFGIFVFLRNKEAKLNRLFCLVCLSVFIWASGYSQMYNTKNNYQLALFWARIGYVGVVFIPVFTYHYIVTFLELRRKASTIPFMYFLGICFLFISRTDLFLHSGYTYFWGYYPKAGPLYIFFVLFFAWIFLRVVALLYFGLRHSKKSSLYVQVNKIKYVLLGFAIATTSIIDYAQNYGIEVYPWGYLSALGWLMCMGWASFKYRLMDIALAWRYSVAYLGYALISVAVFLPFIIFLPLSRTMVISLFSLGFLVAPYFYKKLITRFQSVALGKKYNYWQDLDKFKEIELGYISEQIAWNLVEGIAEIMQVDRLSFFMYIKNRKELRPQAQIGLDEEIGCEPIPFVVLRQENPLIRFLADSKGPLLKDELKESDLIAQEMQKVYAEVSIPVFVQNRLTGVLNLGPKPNQEMYHQEDIKKLTELCHQTENHLSHTLFMEERTSFSRELAHDMKNLFVKAIEPTVETILETTDPSRKDKEIKTLAKQLGYLNICLKDNFDLISLLEKIVYHKYTLEPVSLARVISTCASLYKAPLVEKELSLELDISKDLPLVLLNKEDIPKVFNNLFDNSLKFTPRGGKITIKVERKENEVLVTFSDTGPGIEKEKLENIFEPEVKMPDEGEEGTGLGLVIVRDIIEAHKGRIRVESEPGKGTTFYFTLPIAKEVKSGA